MNNYTEQREWSDRFIPEICALVGPYLLKPASFELDTQEATDLIILTARDMRIAARIRKPGYEWADSEFTIRYWLPSCVKTELQKVKEGWGDWMFYGHANPSGGIRIWHLLDLHVFRDQMNHRPDSVKWSEQKNGDGSKFIAFSISSFPSSMVVARG